jgi:hypothetical protein
MSCSRFPDLGVGAGGAGNAGHAGGGGAGNAGGGGAGLGGAGGGGAGLGGAGGTGGVVEPPGASVITLVNGVSDFDEARFCFVPTSGGAPTLPWPEAGGLAFAEHAVFAPDELGGGADVRVVVIVGELSLTEGLDCEGIEALAASLAVPPQGGGGAGGGGAGMGGMSGGGTGGAGGGGAGTGGAGGAGMGGAGGAGGVGGAGGAVPEPPYVPPLFARSIAVVPASALDSGKSLALVTAGCAGSFSHLTEKTGCGLAYSPTSPTVTLVAAPMSRITTPNRLNFQVLDASVPMPASDVRVKASEAADLPIAFKLTLGDIQPFPPWDALARASLGDLSAAAVRTTLFGNATAVTSETTLTELLTASGLDPAELVDGEPFTLVALGGAPGAAPQAFWKGFRLVVLRSDP